MTERQHGRPGATPLLHELLEPRSTEQDRPPAASTGVSPLLRDLEVATHEARSAAGQEISFGGAVSCLPDPQPARASQSSVNHQPLLHPSRPTFEIRPHHRPRRSPSEGSRPAGGQLPDLELRHRQRTTGRGPDPQRQRHRPDQPASTPLGQQPDLVRGRGHGRELLAWAQTRYHCTGGADPLGLLQLSRRARMAPVGSFDHMTAHAGEAMLDRAMGEHGRIPRGCRVGRFGERRADRAVGAGPRRSEGTADGDQRGARSHRPLGLSARAGLRDRRAPRRSPVSGRLRLRLPA